MVRVLFVAAPFKRAFFAKMIEYFSTELESELLAPVYPQTSANSSPSAFAKASRVLFGGQEVTEALSGFKPDFIYSDSPLYGTHLKLSQLSLKMRIPLVIHLRGDIWREFLGWILRSPFRKRLLGSPSQFEGLLGLRFADRLTPICKWLECEVLRHLPSKPTEVVYQGVDPSEFYPGPGLDLARPAVAIIQNHTVYEKTLGLIGFARVIERLPNVHFYVTTGESVSQSFLPLVKATFSRYENVHFLDRIGHPDGVRQLLAASDLYALPSNLDCCPTTVLEASLMERPVLGSRVGGIPETIYDGHTGWSIPNEDIDGWVNSIRLLVDDARLTRRLGSQGRKWVSRKFGWPQIASQVERLILRDAKAQG